MAPHPVTGGQPGLVLSVGRRDRACVHGRDRCRRAEPPWATGGLGSRRQRQRQFGRGQFVTSQGLSCAVAHVGGAPIGACRRADPVWPGGWMPLSAGAGQRLIQRIDAFRRPMAPGASRSPAYQTVLRMFLCGEPRACLSACAPIRALRGSALRHGCTGVALAGLTGKRAGRSGRYLPGVGKDLVVRGTGVPRAGRGSADGR
jgi:hypothetical protein